MSISKIIYFNRSSIHYRKEIYLALENELDTDFYFGDKRPGKIKELDINLLKNFRGYLHNIVFKEPIYWQRGALSLAFKPYDVYITPGEATCLSTWLLAVLCRLKGKKVYFWSHGCHGVQKGFRGFVTKLHFALASGGFLYGEYAKECLTKMGCNPSKLHVIYNSLSYDEQNAVIATNPISDIYIKHFGNSDPVLVFIGRLIKSKRIEMLINATASLLSSGQSVNCVIVGDGECRQSLQELVIEKNIANRVWFYGPSYDEHNNAELLSNAALCVSPGEVGLTAIHSLTYGTPVITHNNYYKQGPEFEAITEEVTGSFYEYENDNSLTAAIKKWLPRCINEREQIRKYCRKVVDEKYNPHYQISVIKKAINYGID